MVMYRTSLGLGKMKLWSERYPRTYLWLSYLSIFVGVVGMVLFFFFMIWQLHFIMDRELTTGGGLVLPLKTEKGLDSAVPVFYVPFWYWIIAIALLMIVHEFAHGVIAERFKIKIKSSGLAFFGIFLPILPGAFVEPDEKQLQKKPWWQQIAVLGAGSTSNLLFGALFLVMWILAAGFLVDTTMAPGEIGFSQVMNESSLSQYNLSSGGIVSYNGINDSETILRSFQNLSVNETLNLTINSSGNVATYEVTTFENPRVPDDGMIGISGLQFSYVNEPGYEWLGQSPLHVERVLFYLWFLNIGIGLMNLLPLWITDGGQIARVLFRRYFSEERSMQLVHLVSLISLILIIFTVWPGSLRLILGL
jgi:membrane-associated protease RseP (regulator of RpoE activity)